MTDINNLITDNIDVWTSAIKKRNSQGRGSNKKSELVGINRLRELILDLAMRGKLVEQDINDEPASLLIDKIAQEKAQLIAEKKIKKAKAIDTFDMPKVSFDAPKGWSLPTLTELIVNSADHIVDGPFGSNLKSSEYVDSGIPLIRIQNISRNNFKNNGIQYLTETKAESLNRHSFIAGDIVLNKLGEPTGKACIIPEELTYGIMVADLIRVRVDNERHNKQFLIHCINSPIVAYQFSGLAKGVTRQRVNLSQVRSIKVPLPPLAEQHRIVAKVDELMALCDQLEQQTEQSLTAHQTLVEVLLNALFLSPEEDNAEASTEANIANNTELNVQEQAQTSVEEQFQENWQRIADHFDVLFTTEASIDQLKQTILQLAVMGKIVPQNPTDEPASKLLEKIAEEKSQLIADKKIKKPKSLPKITDEEKPFELPSGWAFERLEKMTSLITKGSSPKWQGVSYTEDPTDVLFVTSENVGAFELRLDKKKYVEKKFNDVEPRSILQKHDFLMNIVGASIGRTATYNIATLANINQAVCLIRSFPQWSCNKYFLTFFNSNICISYMYDKQVDNARPNLSMANISKFVIPLPPFEEQQRIVAKVDELMALCDQLKTRLADAQITQLHLADAVVENALSVKKNN